MNRFGVPLVFWMLSVFQVGSQPNTESKQARLDALMKHCHDQGMFNGTVLVSERGKVIYEKAYGYSNFITREPLTTSSAFYLASLSKQFTAMAVMMLKEQGKLSYDDKLTKYFPEFSAFADDVTIKHLLTHTSGIPDYFRLGAQKYGLKNSEVVTALLRPRLLDFKAGEKYSYSNSGYVLLSMIVEKAAGVPFHLFMEQNIFKPLGMKNTLVYDESMPSVNNRALGFNIMDELEDYNQLTSGDGGMFSTTGDLFLWDQALYTEKLVSTQTLQEAFTKATLNNGTSVDYGFGWGLFTVDGANYVNHGGGLSGFRTYIERNITDRHALILLTNHSGAEAMNDIAQAVLKILKGASYTLPKVKTSLALLQLMKLNSAGRSVDMMKELLKKYPERYQNDESGINNLGYQFMSRGDRKTAHAIFNFNVELFPNSSNTFDSYGEVLLAEGDTTNAIINYKRSVELNPGNALGIGVLSSLGQDVSLLTAAIKIPLEILDSYVGRYEIAPDHILTISRVNEQLKIQSTGKSVYDIFPASETRFYFKTFNAQITFNKDENGKVMSITLHQQDETQAKRLEE
jgi:CubicO group peptidase (beta-lactamase class C family)